MSSRESFCPNAATTAKSAFTDATRANTSGVLTSSGVITGSPRRQRPSLRPGNVQFFFPDPKDDLAV